MTNHRKKLFLIFLLWITGKAMAQAPLSTGSNCPPEVITTVPVNPCSGSATVFSTTMGIPYMWDFGDGSPLVNSNSPSHTYASSGNFLITITDPLSGCFHSQSLTVSNCSSQCNVTISFSPTTVCAGNPVTFNSSTSFSSYNWNFGDGTTSTLSSPSHIYSAAANYTVSLSVPATGLCLAQTYTQAVPVTENCAPDVECENCIGTFAPEPGKYVFSVWVKEKDAFNKTSYNLPKVSIEFTGATNIPAFGTDANNKIIDGWQRIEKIIEIPATATHMTIKLLNTGTGTTGPLEVYFDDIRIHPVDGNMKSYVYDPETLRLMADLDENNYATFYEYDEEGALVRVKRETERGIVTVKESRSNIKKD